MNFAGINLSNYMKGNSFGTEQQNALQDAATMADRMSYETFGNAARQKIDNESALKMAKQAKKAGVSIQGMMAGPNAMSGLADLGTSLMSADWSSFGGGGSGIGNMATLDSTPSRIESAYGSSVSYYDPAIYDGVGDY